MSGESADSKYYFWGRRRERSAETVNVKPVWQDSVVALNAATREERMRCEKCTPREGILPGKSVVIRSSPKLPDNAHRS